MKLLTKEKIKIKATLREHGIKYTGKTTNEELVRLYNSIDGLVWQGSGTVAGSTGTGYTEPFPIPNVDDAPNETSFKPSLDTSAVVLDEIDVKPEPASVASSPSVDTSTNDMRKLFEALEAFMPKPQPALDKDELIALIKEHAETSTLVIKPFDGSKVVTIDNAHMALEEVVETMTCRNSDGYMLQPYLVGPAGSGKTTIARNAATALGLDFYCTGAFMASYEILGTKNAHGDYKPTAFYTAYKQGGVYLLDEIDACSAKALTAVNQALANSYFMFPNGELVEKHKNFVAIAGANTIGHGATRQYIGRNPLDGATLDRFETIEVDYDERLEAQLAKATYQANGGTDDALITQWIGRAHKLRDRVKQLELTCIISPRRTIAGAAKLAKSGSLDKAMKHLTGRLSTDQKAQLEVDAL